MTKNLAALLRLSAEIGRADAASGLDVCVISFREGFASEAAEEGLKAPASPKQWTACVDAYIAGAEGAQRTAHDRETLRAAVVLDAERAALASFDDRLTRNALADAAWRRATLGKTLGAALAVLPSGMRDSYRSLHRARFLRSLAA